MDKKSTSTIAHDLTMLYLSKMPTNKLSDYDSIWDEYKKAYDNFYGFAENSTPNTNNDDHVFVDEY